jgi:thymidylate kinase
MKPAIAIRGMELCRHLRQGATQAIKNRDASPYRTSRNETGRVRTIARQQEPRGALIAIVGCDGSGKSTLAADVLRELQKRHRAQLCYLGLRSGELGNRIKRLRGVGPTLERFLSKKAGQARSKDSKIPDLGTALVIYGFSLLRLRRFRQMLSLREKGVIVVTDRYPQTEVPGFYDGPGLSAAQAGSRIVARLAARERRMYEWMTGFRPDIVIRLNVDVETAFARKPDHKIESLKSKVEVTPLLRFNDAKIVDLDSRDPYPQVRDAAFALVEQAVKAHDHRGEMVAA